MLRPFAIEYSMAIVYGAMIVLDDDRVLPVAVCQPNPNPNPKLPTPDMDSTHHTSVPHSQIVNAAVVMDATGQIAGAYHKRHPTDGEIANGVVPGSLDPEVNSTVVEV